MQFKTTVTRSNQLCTFFYKMKHNYILYSVIFRRVNMSSWKPKILVKTRRNYNETVIFRLYFKVIVRQKCRMKYNNMPRSGIYNIDSRERFHWFACQDTNYLKVIDNKDVIYMWYIPWHVIVQDVIYIPEHVIVFHSVWW